MGMGQATGLPHLTYVMYDTREEENRVPNNMEDGPIFSSEILIEQPIDQSIEAAVEIGQEVGCKIKPAGDLACYLFWVEGHQDSEHIDREPAHCKEEEDHEHGQKIVSLGKLVVRILHSGVTGCQHFHPDPHVAKTHDEQREDKVDTDDGRGKDGVVQIVEDAGVGARIILYGANVHVGQNSQAGHDPGDHQVNAGVAHTEDPLILEAVTDVAVTVDGNCHDIEDRANHTQPCDKCDHLAL